MFDYIYLGLSTNDKIGFCVISTSPVRIADEEAYIFLKFAFPNDGEKVFNDDYDNSVFEEGVYLFCIEPEKTSYTTPADVFMRRYSIEKSHVSNYDKEELHKKMETLLKNKYGFDSALHLYEQYCDGERNSYVFVNHLESFAIESELDLDRYGMCRIVSPSTPQTVENTSFFELFARKSSTRARCKKSTVRWMFVGCFYRRHPRIEF